jgi:hypothetical protein
MPRVEMREAAAPARSAVEKVRLLIIMVFTFGFDPSDPATGCDPAHDRHRSICIGLLVLFRAPSRHH